MLSGDWVVLRPIERADLARLWELIEDFEVVLLASSGPIVPTSLAEFETFFDERARERNKDSTEFAIEADGEIIGQCDLHRIAHFSRTCELGIKIGREYWGKGFGQDSVRTLLDYAF